MVSISSMHGSLKDYIYLLSSLNESCKMDYESSISNMLKREIILDINNIFHIKIWRFHFGLYSPLSLRIRKTRSFFPTLNFYSVNHWWQSPFYFRYKHPLVEKIESSY